MAAGAGLRASLLPHARRIARRCALRHPQRLATADDVYEKLTRSGHPEAALRQIAGSIFRGSEWVATCLRVRSGRASNRSREIKVWRLLEEGLMGGRSRTPSPIALLVGTHRPAKPFPEELLSHALAACSLCHGALLAGGLNGLGKSHGQERNNGKKP